MPHRRPSSRRAFLSEPLEPRTLLSVASETFSPPSLTALTNKAQQGQDTSKQAINLMVSSLQDQLSTGPLADLQSGAVNGNGFIQEVQGLEASYEQSVNHLLSNAPGISAILELQGQRVLDDLIAVNQQSSVGLVSDLPSAAQSAISSLTSGPILPLRTPITGYVSTTQSLETTPNTLAHDLGSSSLTVSQVVNTLLADAEAYRADINAACLVTHSPVAAEVDRAVTALETAALGLPSDSPSDAQTALQSALSSFDSTIYGTKGIFGPQGHIQQTIRQKGYVPASTPPTRDLASLGQVSGSASGGSASLTATLLSSSGSPISGAIVAFTLDGAFAGAALTDASGTATLSAVPTSAPPGTHPGSIVALFAGNPSYRPANTPGDLTVS